MNSLATDGTTKVVYSVIMSVSHVPQDDKQVKDWHRVYDDILRCRRVLLQTGIVKYPAHEEIGFLRSAFYRSLLRLLLLFYAARFWLVLLDLSMYVCPQIFAAAKRPLQSAGQPPDTDNSVRPDCRRM